MGCGQSNQHQATQYSVGINTPAKIGETEIRRSTKSVNCLIEVPDPENKTLKDCLKRVVSKHTIRDFLGTQKNDVYQFTSYGSSSDQAKQIGSGIINLNLAPPLKEYLDLTLKFVGVYSKNREEWILLDMANIYYGFTMVPFYDTLGVEAIPFIFNQTNLTTIFVSAASVKVIIQLKKQELCKLKNIVLFDEIPTEDLAVLEKLGLKVYTLKQVMTAGKENPQSEANVKPDDIYTLSYTSGTTGNPKGAMLTHKNFVSLISAIPQTSVKLSETDVYLSYLPLPHVMERLAYLFMLYYGGSIGFYRGDPLLLKEDIQRLRPTFFVSVPRLYNKFYDGIKAKIEAVEGGKRYFVDKAIKTKLENLRSNAQYTHVVYDKAFEAVRELFGGRIRFMLTGSAPINREVIDFLKIAACCPIYEGFGQTESTGVSFITLCQDPNSGHVGGPTTNSEFKLQDIPEMKYSALDIDEETKLPCPRGEICIRGPGVFKGYYKDMEKTKEAIDEDGWLHTGDVGLILPGGNIKIIDRKKNIFKLSQGEYIAPEKIENIYLRAKGVAEVFVYGDSLQNNCVSIVVPVKDYIEAQGKEKGIQGTFEDLCLDPNMVKLILDNLIAQGKIDKLNSLEQVKAVYLEPVSFQLQGCMTTTFKLQRIQAKQKFLGKIKQMYTALNQ